MIQRLITVILTILVALFAVAGTITGRVVDENQVPMPYANVVLMNRADSAFVQGTHRLQRLPVEDFQCGLCHLLAGNA